MSGKLKLALGILSGRVKPSNLDTDDWHNLGYETYNFGSFGKPGKDEIKHDAEMIIAEAIGTLVCKVDKLEVKP